jgi:hypothetical protein
VRLDRGELRARLPDHPAWVLDDLLDAFEPAAVAAMAEAAEAKRKRDRRARKDKPE